MPRIIGGEKNNIVGENIRILRVTRRMSQQDLADKLEAKNVYVCRGSISRIEDGLRTVTDIELKGFSEVFGVSVNDLFVERDVFGEQIK
ncbi:MAG: helix-turn-helix domain-containing protein [Acutalibacteraceae bacterium]|nr:helix-turn-helix transcriptional regulator [Bacillota bacterium]